MANNDKVVRRGVYLYIDGKEIKNDIRSIQAECNQLVNAQKRMVIGSNEYKTATARIAQLKGILAEHRAQLSGIETQNKKNTLSVGKFVDGFNRVAGVVAAGAAAIAGFVLGLKSLRDMKNELEDSQANLKALTGLDDDSIKWLTDQANELSTHVEKSGLRVRKSAKEILDAYTLVGSAKPELLTDKEALNAVTIEAMRLAEAAKMDLNEAVNGVTLAMNQYSASANQAARYTNTLAAGSKFGAVNVQSQTAAIVKSGVAAAAANVPIEQLVGSIETLGEKGIKDEIAGTGLKKFFLVLQTGARDTNPAVVGLGKALDNLKKQQLSASEIKKMFGEEGYNVASVMINSADKVKYYTKAVTDTNVAVEQATINSNTASAKLAQARNEMNRAGIELATKLNPAFTVSTNSLTYLIRILPKLVDFIKEHKRTLTILISTLLYYTVVQQLSNEKSKLMVFWNETVKGSFQKLWAVIRANPWTATITAVALVVSYFSELNKKLTDVEKRQKMLNDVNSEATSEADNQTRALTDLLKIARDSNASHRSRIEAIRQLNDLSPEYLGNLKLENINTQDANIAVDNYTKAILANAKAKAINAKLDEIAKAKLDLKSNMSNSSSWYDTFSVSLNNVANVAEKVANTVGSLVTHGDLKGWDQSTFIEKNGYALNTTAEAMNRYNSAMTGYVKDEKALQKELTEVTKKQVELSNTPLPNNPGNNGDDEKKKKKAVKADLLKEDLRYEQESSDLKNQYLKNDEMTREDYASNVEMIEHTHLVNQLKIAGLEPAERQKILQKMLDAEIAFKNKAADLKEKTDKENEDKAISRRDKQFQLDLEAAAQYHYKNRTSEENFQQSMSQIQSEYWTDLLNNYNLTEEEKTRILIEQNKKRTDESKDKFEKDKENQKKYKDIIENTASDFGQTLGEMIANGELSFHDFLKQILLYSLDALEKMVQMTIVQVILDNMKWSFFGIAKATAEIAAINAAFAAVKGVVSNFYTGGYTPDGSWNQPQGIVHSNEFVSNRFAVANPNIRPVLDLIDAAQRTGSVQNLTANDVAAVLPSSIISQGKADVKSGTVSISDITLMQGLVSRMTSTVKKLTERLEQPFYTISNVAGNNGVKKALSDYEKLLKNKSRS